jgi:dTDP-glucose 4,6-dehydratase
MNFSNKKILVTGADGFIGSHLAEELVRLGHDVRAFVFYNSFNSWGWLDHADPEIKKRLDVFAGDIRDPHGVKEAMIRMRYGVSSGGAYRYSLFLSLTGYLR